MARGAAPGHMHSREESRLPADLGLQILTRNQPVDNRGEVFGNAVLATAILNRLLYLRQLIQFLRLLERVKEITWLLLIKCQ